MPRDQIGSTDGKVIGSDEVIKMVLIYGKLLGTVVVNVDVITFGVDVVTELVSLDGYFDDSNDGKLEGLFLSKLLGSDYIGEVGATNGWSEPNPNPNPNYKLGSSDVSFDGYNDGKLFWFNVWFSVSFTHSLTPLVGFFSIGALGVCCFVRKLLWQKKIL